LIGGSTFVSEFKEVRKEIENLLEPHGLSWESFFPYWGNFYYLGSKGNIKSDEEMFLQEMPQIKFKLNKNLDKRVANNFLFLKGGGIDFGKGIIKDHPKLGSLRNIKQREKRKKLISNYIDSFYQIHRPQLQNIAQKFNREWRKKEKEFFNSIAKIFKNYPWPKGKYIGYLSIFNCNPRNLKDKTFQIYYKHPAGVVYVTAHELLHFIFYDYSEKKFKKDFKKISEGKLWKISEVFNSVLFSFKPSSKFAPSKVEKFDYPAFKKEIKKAKRIWKTSKDVDKLISTLLEIC